MIKNILHIILQIIKILFKTVIITNTIIVFIALIEQSMLNNAMGNTAQINEIIVFFQQDSEIIIRTFIIPIGKIIFIAEILSNIMLYAVKVKEIPKQAKEKKEIQKV